MKINTTHKHIDTTSKSHVRVEITETQHIKFIERDDGTQVLSIGAGQWKNITPRTFRTVCRSIIRTARSYKIEKLAVQMDRSSFPQLDEAGDEAWVVSTMIENFIIANYEFTRYKSQKPAYDLKELLICGTLHAAAKRGYERGKIVGEYTNICRDIANTPGGEMTPQRLADQAKKAAVGTNVKVTVFDTKRIAKERMHALLGVGQGAKHQPRFIVMEYWGAGKGGGPTKAPIVFVGKGITFDTGGLNIKPGESMLDMHLDMSGGAATIATVAAAAKLNLKKNIIGLIPAAENAVSSESFRPGDILKTRSGKTVDVLNTDAEGRLVLADALSYAATYKPRLVIDVATLTGAAIVALGEHASAVLTKDDELRETLMRFSEESGDYVWPLPLWDEYKQYTKGRFGDISNIASCGNPRAGGTINGGVFLSHFTDELPKNCPWAHIDMAPRMTAVASDKLAKGATGEPVRLLIKIAEKY